MISIGQLKKQLLMLLRNKLFIGAIVYDPLKIEADENNSDEEK